MGSLKELQMPQNGILHEGITALADALTTNTNLRLLNMNDNTFTEAGAKAMAKVILVTKVLTVCIISLMFLVFTVTISLPSNPVKVTSLYNLQALPNLQNLEVLNFGDCLVRTKGAEAIADAIKDSHTNLKVRVAYFVSSCRRCLFNFSRTAS